MNGDEPYRFDERACDRARVRRSVRGSCTTYAKGDAVFLPFVETALNAVTLYLSAIVSGSDAHVLEYQAEVTASSPHRADRTDRRGNRPDAGA